MKINKWAIVGGILGGVYSLIYYLSINALGEGSYIIYVFPPFWFILGTFILLSLIITFFVIYIFSLNSDYIGPIANNLNYFLWIIIGGILGYLINKKNKKIGMIIVFIIFISLLILGGIYLSV